MFESLLVLLAQAADLTPPGPPPEKSAFGPELIYAAIIFIAAFYFLIQRPQRKADEERQKTIESLDKGTRVVSAGGIYGTVSRVNKDKGTVLVTVAKGIELEFGKNYITVVKEEPPKATS